MSAPHFNFLRINANLHRLAPISIDAGEDLLDRRINDAVGRIKSFISVQYPKHKGLIDSDIGIEIQRTHKTHGKAMKILLDGQSTPLQNLSEELQVECNNFLTLLAQSKGEPDLAALSAGRAPAHIGRSPYLHPYSMGPSTLYGDHLSETAARERFAQDALIGNLTKTNEELTTQRNAAHAEIRRLQAQLAGLQAQETAAQTRAATLEADLNRARTTEVRSQEALQKAGEDHAAAIQGLQAEMAAAARTSEETITGLHTQLSTLTHTQEQTAQELARLRALYHDTLKDLEKAKTTDRKQLGRIQELSTEQTKLQGALRDAGIARQGAERQIQELRETISGLTTQNQNLRETLRSQTDQAHATGLQAQETIANLKAQLTQNTNQLTQLQTTLDAAKATNRELEKAQKDLIADNAALHIHLLVRQRANSKLNTKNKDLQRQLEGIHDSVNAAFASKEQAEEKLRQAENNIEELTQALTHLKEQLTTSEESLKKAVADVERLNQKEAGLEAFQESYRREIQILQEDLKTRYDRETSLKTEVSSLREELKKSEKRSAGAQETIQTLRTREAELAANLTARQEELDGLRSSLTAESSTSSEQQKTLQAKEAELGAAKTELAKVQGLLTTVQAEKQSADNKIADLELKVQSLTGQRDSLSTTIATQESRIQELEITTQRQSQEITQLGTALSAAETKVTALESDKASLQSHAQQLRAAYDALEADNTIKTSNISSLAYNLSQELQRIVGLQASLQTAQEARTAAQAQITAMNESFSQEKADLLAQMQSREAGLQAELTGQKAIINGLQSQLKEMTEACQKTAAEAEAAKKAAETLRKDAVKRAQEITQLENRSAESLQKIRDLTFERNGIQDLSSAQLVKLSKELEDEQKKVRELKATMESHSLAYKKGLSKQLTKYKILKAFYIWKTQASLRAKDRKLQELEAAKQTAEAAHQETVREKNIHAERIQLLETTLAETQTQLSGAKKTSSDQREAFETQKTALKTEIESLKIQNAAFKAAEKAARQELTSSAAAHSAAEGKLKEELTQKTQAHDQLKQALEQAEIQIATHAAGAHAAVAHLEDSANKVKDLETQLAQATLTAAREEHDKLQAQSTLHEAQATLSSTQRRLASIEADLVSVKNAATEQKQSLEANAETVGKTLEEANNQIQILLGKLSAQGSTNESVQSELRAIIANLEQINNTNEAAALDCINLLKQQLELSHNETRANAEELHNVHAEWNKTKAVQGELEEKLRGLDATQKAEINRLRSELNDAMQRLGEATAGRQDAVASNLELQSALNAANATSTQLRAQLETAGLSSSEALNSLNTQLSDAHNQLAEREAALAQAGAALQAQLQEITAKTSEFERQLAALRSHVADKDSENLRLSTALAKGLEDIRELHNQLAKGESSFGQVQAANAHLKVQYETLQRAAGDLQVKFENVSQQLQAEKAAHAEKVRELEAFRKEHTEITAQLETRLQSAERALQTAEHQAEHTIDGLRKEIAKHKARFQEANAEAQRNRKAVADLETELEKMGLNLKKFQKTAADKEAQIIYQQGVITQLSTDLRNLDQESQQIPGLRLDLQKAVSSLEKLNIEHSAAKSEIMSLQTQLTQTKMLNTALNDEALANTQAKAVLLAQVGAVLTQSGRSAPEDLNGFVETTLRELLAENIESKESLVILKGLYDTTRDELQEATTKEEALKEERDALAEKVADLTQALDQKQTASAAQEAALQQKIHDLQTANNQLSIAQEEARTVSDHRAALLSEICGILSLPQVEQSYESIKAAVLELQSKLTVLKNEGDSARADVRRVEEQLEQARTELATAEGRRKSLGDRVRIVEGALNIRETAEAEYQARIAGYQAEAAGLSARVAGLEATNATLEERAEAMLLDQETLVKALRGGTSSLRMDRLAAELQLVATQLKFLNEARQIRMSPRALATKTFPSNILAAALALGAVFPEERLPATPDHPIAGTKIDAAKNVQFDWSIDQDELLGRLKSLTGNADTAKAILFRAMATLDPALLDKGQTSYLAAVDKSIPAKTLSDALTKFLNKALWLKKPTEDPTLKAVDHIKSYKLGASNPTIANLLELMPNIAEYADRAGMNESAYIIQLITRPQEAFLNEFTTRFIDLFENHYTFASDLLALQMILNCIPRNTTDRNIEPLRRIISYLIPLVKELCMKGLKDWCSYNYGGAGASSAPSSGAGRSSSNSRRKPTP